MSGGRIALLVIGIILLVIALGMVICGAGMVTLSQTLTNDSGFVTSGTAELVSSSYAIISEPVEVDWGDTNWDPADVLTLRIEVSSNNGKPVFVGIGSQSDVEHYFNNVPYDQVTSWATRHRGTSSISYQHYPGNSAPSPPTLQTFWQSSAYGSGDLTLTWAPESGNWTMVLMNQDGSAGINVDGKIGAKVPWLFPAGLGILIAGFILLVVGIAMIVLAARRPKPAVSAAT